MAHEVHIVGAGLAGTCLALSLIEAKFEGPVTLYDSAEEFDRERHWCTWGPLPRYLRPYVSHSWTDFQVVTPGESVRRRTVGSPYVHIESGPFFSEAHRRLRRAENVRIVLGESVDPDDLIHGYVFDATDRSCGEAVLTQSTVGRRVRFDRPVAGRSVRLMDFQDPRYMTVLPFGPREALIETTRIDARGTATEEDLAALDTYIGQEFPGRSRIVSTTEHAMPVLFEDPVGCDEPMRARLGICGCALPGTARYGLARIISQVSAMTPAVCRGDRLPSLRPHAAVRWVESQLVHRIAEGPSLAMESFASMFRLPAEAATRFLTGRPTWSDLAGVLLALSRKPIPTANPIFGLRRERLAV